MTFKERQENNRRFVRELETVSAELAVWAQSKIADGWSISDVKTHIRNAMQVCERD